MITRSRAGTEVESQNAGASKVLTTERLVFFSDDLEMESGQGNVGLHIMSDYTLPFRATLFLVVSLQHNVTSNTIKTSITY